MPELYRVLYDESTAYDSLFFTESWLNNYVPDSLLDTKGHYAVFRSDRQ